MKKITSQSRKTILMYQPDRYIRRGDAIGADQHFEQHVPCNFLVALTWEDFIEKIDKSPDLIGFHLDLNPAVDGCHVATIRAIETLLKLKNKNAGIFVTVNKNITQKTINTLRKTNIIGLQLARGHFGLDTATDSWQQLLAGPYWPEEIISELAQDKLQKPLHVYFRDDVHEFAEEDQFGDLPASLQLCRRWSELSSAICNHPKNIVFHLDMVQRHGGTISEFMMMLETMIKYADAKTKPNIGVCIESDTPLSIVKELQKNKILALVPSPKTLGITEYKAAVSSMLNDRAYWPKDVISKLPGNVIKIKSSSALTARQQDVFNLIARRGLSNKQIARVLNISESTVKIHVSAVMKNLCVRNRTQLALTK